MEVDVYIGDSYNAFTQTCQTSYFILDAASHNLVQSGKCRLNVSKQSLPLLSIKRAVQALFYLHEIKKATIYTDSSFALNVLKGRLDNKENKRLAADIKQRIKSLPMDIQIQHCCSDDVRIPNEYASTAETLPEIRMMPADYDLLQQLNFICD